MKKCIAVICSILFASIIGCAQTISGKITDNQGSSIPNAVIILQNSDSVFVQAVTSDLSGVFHLPINIASGFVVIQHLAYEPKTIAFSSNNLNSLKNITLSNQSRQLESVTVNANSNTVTIKDNALVYNAQQIAEKKAVNNAFELLRYTPGLTVRDNSINLVGASQLTIIIDGKATMLSNSDIADMLKSLPASQIENIEVMYKAPAKYGVKGALINIVTDKKQRQTPLVAELASEYTQKFYASGLSRANVAYRGEKLDVDVLANVSGGTTRFEIYDYSINNFNDVQTVIDQQSNSGMEKNGNTFRTSIDYNFNEDNVISLMYYGKSSKYHDPIKAETKFLSHTGDTSMVNSTNDENDKNLLHNVNLKGVFGGASITADYVSYFDKTESKYIDLENNNITTDYHNNSTMDIDQLKLLASYDWVFSDVWQMSVGAQGTMTNSATEVSYLYPNGNSYELDKSSYGDNLQKERRFSAFGESINTIFDSIQLDFTFEVEYFKSDYDQNGVKTTLWDEWHVYPSLSVMWPLKRDIIQFSASTYKTYPSYWVLSPHTTQMNPYKFMIGNPTLKPSTCYDVEFSYLIKKQYNLNAYFIYEKGSLHELPYQNAEELRNYYQTVNFDHELFAGLGGEVPIEAGFWESNLFLFFQYAHDKMSNFHNTSFDRSKCSISAGIENTFTVSEAKPNLAFTLDAEYLSKTIEGIYDSNYGYNLEIGMKWGILDNLIFTAKWSDIFERWGPYPAIVDYNGQYNKINNQLFNTFKASLVWRIGGFNAKDVEMTDTERMKR